MCDSNPANWAPTQHWNGPETRGSNPPNQAPGQHWYGTGTCTSNPPNRVPANTEMYLHHTRKEPILDPILGIGRVSMKVNKASQTHWPCQQVRCCTSTYCVHGVNTKKTRSNLNGLNIFTKETGSPNVKLILIR